MKWDGCSCWVLAGLTWQGVDKELVVLLPPDGHITWLTHLAAVLVVNEVQSGTAANQLYIKKVN